MPLLALPLNRLYALPPELRDHVLMRAVQQGSEIDVCKIFDSLTRTDHALHDNVYLLRAVINELRMMGEEREEEDDFGDVLRALPQPQDIAQMSLGDMRTAVLYACRAAERHRIHSLIESTLWRINEVGDDDPSVDWQHQITAATQGGDIDDEVREWLVEALNNNPSLTEDELFEIMKEGIREYDDNSWDRDFY